ncbi:MAG: asparagine synthase (glutamine-hydrolyzing), partial [Candidatus Desulforudis sp.]|nr:asparagine synthase (glutamine-hydrolyzing) [Desulforudis sp.]
MCGIAGYIGLSNDIVVDENIVRKMCGTLVHRGPDDEGVLVRGNIGLGMRRLSIIDLAGGGQPMGCETGDVQVVCNGEIYNFREIRERLEGKGHRWRTASDTECLVHLYEEYGVDCVHHINGMFAFCLWDSRTGTVLLARDRLGKKPLYYTVHDNRFIYGSELKALLQYPGIARELDPLALDLYLTYDYVPAPYCILKGFSKLEPGFRMIIRDGLIRREAYWNLSYEPKPGRVRKAELVDELHDRLGEAVRKRLVADVPLGMFLSGGLDSGIVAALARKHVSGTLKTFSIGFEDRSFDESAYARRVAEVLETDHRERTFRTQDLLDLVPGLPGVLDEPMADPSVLPTYLLSRFTKERVTVALAGDGGDELFAGYPTYQAHVLADYYNRLPRPLKWGIEVAVGALPVSHANLSFDFKAKQFLKGTSLPLEIRNFVWKGGFSAEERRQLYTSDLRWLLQAYDSFTPVQDLITVSDARNPLDRALYLDSKLYLQDDILVKVDRASMACSLEVRAPLLDYELVDWAARLPARFKMKGLTTKYLLKRLGDKLLPKQTVHRSKK